MTADPSDPDRTVGDELTGQHRLRDMGKSEPLLLTAEEAAKTLRVGRTTLYALLKTGDLRSIHIGRSCRISRAELERYVRHLQAPPPPASPRKHRRGITTDQAELFDVVHTPHTPRDPCGRTAMNTAELPETSPSVNDDGGAEG